MPSTDGPHDLALWTDSFRQVIAGSGGVVLRIDAACVMDGAGASFAPGSLLLECAEVERVAVNHTETLLAEIRVLGIGPPESIDAGRDGAHRITLPRSMITPGLVNAHTHLDLTAVGSLANIENDSFADWLDSVRRERPLEPDAIRRSVMQGVEASIRGGVCVVGDIAGAAGGRVNFAAFDTLRESPLAGISFAEFFGIGRGVTRAAEAIGLIEERASVAPPGRVRLGLSPHAPNTVGLEGYLLAAEAGRRVGLQVCSHIAESIDERRFVADASGPQRELLESLGLWDETIQREVGHGRTPISHVGSVLDACGAGFLVVHANDVSDRDLEVLRETGSGVVYCPRSSAFFHHPERVGRHRWREMRKAGIPVALGTDSVASLPVDNADPASNARLSPLDEVRHLCRVEGLDPVLDEASALLSMVTCDGARVLGLDPGAFQFRGGMRLGGLAMVDIGEGKSDLRGVLSRAFCGSGRLHVLLCGK